MLTHEQIKQLEKPFTQGEHNSVSGNAYILKSAIMGRLSQVDPAWQMTPPDILSHVDDVVIVRGGLILANVTRYAFGTGIITRTKTDKSTGEISELPYFEQQRQVSKAYKSAQSDLLPRCAVLFGIGQYLKEKPRNMALEKFLPDALAAWRDKWSRLDHWTFDPQQQQAFSEAMKQAGLSWQMVSTQLEPGKVLSRLSDTSLSFTEAIARLEGLRAG